MLIFTQNIVDTEKPDGTCSHTFALHEFSGLFLNPSIFSIKPSRFAKIKNGALSDFQY